MTGPWTEDQAAHLQLLFYDQIGMCGCGQPGAALDTVLGLLNLAPFYDHGPELRALLGPDPGIQQLVLSLLDGAGLTEHGGSVWGSWLTAKGRAVRALLAAGPPGGMDDLLDGAGYPHDGPCPDGGCWVAWGPGEDET